MPSEVSMPYKDLKDLILDVVREAKQPDAETAQRLAEEKARKDRIRKENQAAIAAEMKAQTDRQRACNHTKENGRPSTVITLLSDRKYHEMCLRCQLMVREWEPNADELMAAVG